MEISNGTTDPRHRRRNIRPPATTDQALRAARPKGRPRAWLLPFYHPKCPPLSLGTQFITPNVQVTDKTFNDNCIAFCPIRDTVLPIFIQIPRFHPPLWHFSAQTRHSTLSPAPNVRPVSDGPQIVFSQIYSTGYNTLVIEQKSGSTLLHSWHCRLHLLRFCSLKFGNLVHVSRVVVRIHLLCSCPSNPQKCKEVSMVFCKTDIKR